MKTLIKKLGILVIIATVVISFLPAYTATAATSTDLQDGAEYRVDVSLLKPGTGATTKETSAANRYIKQQATIKVENNQPYLYITLNNQTYWQTLATNLASTAPQVPSPESNYTDIYQNVTDVSTDEANNTKVVKIKFDDVNAIIYSYMHINVAEIKYDSWYQADMKMDVSTLQIVTEAPTSPDANSSIEAPTTVSSEPQSSTSTEQNINVENPVLSQSSESDTQTSTPSSSTTPATSEEAPTVITPTPPTLDEGTYNLPFEAKHATKDQASTMQKYFNNPALIQIKNGRKFVVMTINDSKTVTSFQTTVDGSLTDVTVLSEDTENNTRTVQFEITDETAELLAHVTYAAVIGNGNIYNGKADFRLLFDTTAAKSADATDYPTVTKTALADGTYTLPFDARHATKEQASSMQKYFNNPVYLQIKRRQKIRRNDN
ncbi:NEAT domain-containing protein [Brochothrix campestris]|uniref:Sortase B cell surface sorting signal domain-containing protein n=1 Tax=Brochothrix campestris FSL F6-1037 TaxID=1265861 RepID=W7CI47_9LIST|nr:NEAT domain-containing protein [Brochothrix campestris]EUJ35471.1 sortase B cell surface sorting signal domain-containing protein [Brochothrix campestris FSL F6-1037]